VFNLRPSVPEYVSTCNSLASYSLAVYHTSAKVAESVSLCNLIYGLFKWTLEKEVVDVLYLGCRDYKVESDIVSPSGSYQVLVRFDILNYFPVPVISTSDICVSTLKSNCFNFLYSNQQEASMSQIYFIGVTLYMLNISEGFPSIISI